MSAARRLLASTITRGRYRGGDGKDGFRGCIALDETFLPLLVNPAAAHRDRRAQPQHPPAVGPPDRPALRHPAHHPHPKRGGRHRDMYGVTDDLSPAHTPRMAIKVAHYLTDLTPDCGLTMFLPGSHHATQPPTIDAGAIDPPGAITPDLGPCNVVLFENRTFHASGVNTSGQPRIAFMLQYGYPGLQPVDDPAPHLLHRADLDPITRQLLGAPDRNPDGSLAKGAGAAPLRRWWATTTAASAAPA
ncbi:phytanoyl-CoA dioxygenase family protein [Nonomuraea sp. JJY05]|uniref:phytanoyl-CoA dioxygenase family protein n=1 Tax=Nonomuraea sp. JJY05 TaxID=3350255 RepID=UPI00373F7016